MSNYNNNLIKKLSLSSKSLSSGNSTIIEEAMTETMSNPTYLRQSSSLINDALQKGFDVLQLADGDIVMTGVKTVVYQYSWDDKQGKLVRNKASAKKNNTPISKPKMNMDSLEQADLQEEEEPFSDHEDA